MLRFVIAAVLGLSLWSAAPAQSADIPVRGADSSWPNCPKGMGIPKRKTEGKPMPKKSAEFVILGLTNGPGFVRNPCIADQVEWVRSRELYLGAYAMTTFPRPREIREYATAGPWRPNVTRNRLRNAGFAQARFNVATMAELDMRVPFVWVDIEHYPTHPWTSQRWRNRAVLDGVLRGYRSAGFDVGMYTSPGPFRDIIGYVDYNIPEWRTAGGPEWSNTDWGSAARMCTVSSVHGPIWVAQWWDRKRDYDVLCPRARSKKIVKRLFELPGAAPAPQA